jgi:hypothetical protein
LGGKGKGKALLRFQLDGANWIRLNQSADWNRTNLVPQIAGNHQINEEKWNDPMG